MKVKLTRKERTLLASRAVRLEGVAENLARLDDATKEAVRLSERNIGVFHTGRQNRALLVFAKLISHNMSIMAIVNKCLDAPRNAALLDHFSVAALGRISIDAGLMTMYLSEPSLSVDAWNLRRHVLYLHDTTNRKRLLHALAKYEKINDGRHLEGYEESKADLISSVKNFGTRCGLTPEAVEKLLKGEVYVSGVRGAVREAGWDVDAFESHTAYFSAYIHSHPVSFMRADEHNLSFSEPSDFQKYLCNYVMGVIAVYTESANERIRLFCDSFASDPLGHVE